MYCANHNKAQQMIDEMERRKPRFQEFLAQVKEHPQSGGWDLKMFLITPVQRLLRYSLLLKDYLHHTLPTHEDVGPTNELLVLLERHATLVNSSIRREENSKKLMEICASFSSIPKEVSDFILGSDHLYYRDGPLTKVCRKTNMRRWFWLFSDCLIYGSASGIGTQSYTYHRHFPISKVRVQDLPDTDSLPSFPHTQPLWSPPHTSVPVVAGVSWW